MRDEITYPFPNFSRVMKASHIYSYSDVTLALRRLKSSLTLKFVALKLHESLDMFKREMNNTGFQATYISVMYIQFQLIWHKQICLSIV